MPSASLCEASPFYQPPPPPPPDPPPLDPPPEEPLGLDDMVRAALLPRVLIRELKWLALNEV